MTNEESSTLPSFKIIRIYTKKIIFDVPAIPTVFFEEYKAKRDVYLEVKTAEVKESYYEVTLEAKISIKQQEADFIQTLLQQAGLFEIKNYTEGDKERLLNSFCPAILYPYLSEIFSRLIIQSTLPAIYLPFVNFESLYLKRKEQKGF